MKVISLYKRLIFHRLPLQNRQPPTTESDLKIYPNSNTRRKEASTSCTLWVLYQALELLDGCHSEPSK